MFEKNILFLQCQCNNKIKYGYKIMPIIIRQVGSKEEGRKEIFMDQGMPKLPLQMYKDMNTNGKISQIK